MARKPAKKVAFITSYLPRKCGIATFSGDLVSSTARAAGSQFEPLVVAMRPDYDDTDYTDPVKFEIRQNVKRDYLCAADYINFSHVDVVSVQHEFGLFGGSAGSYLNLLLDRLKPPVITTLHTVINDPEESYHTCLIKVCNASEKVIVMNERGISMLDEIYGIRGKKIQLVAHGIPDLPFVDNNYYKHKFNMEGRRTIMTFGLLGRNKGVEVMLKAMPEIVKAQPNALYIILGKTHPAVVKNEGESYRFSLKQMVKDLGIQKHVIFYDRFVSDEELSNFLCATDVYVTPYLNAEQLTSGTLSFAVGTGKAVVSTPYWAAVELLSDGRGKIVPFDDPKETANAVIDILRDDSVFYSLRRKAYEYGRSRTWPKIGQVYWKLFNGKLASIEKQTAKVSEVAYSFEVPEPSLVHLKRLTDDTGMFQHAKFTIPNRLHGYCTDDNARAVIVMNKYYAQSPDPEALTLFDRYLSFILHSQKSDGTVRNFMNYDRTWVEDEPVSDAIGRFLWALGCVMAEPPVPLYISIVKDYFDRSVSQIDKCSARTMAYSILGMSDYLKQFPGASDIKRCMSKSANALADMFCRNSRSDWQWFEDILTYDNGVLANALFVAGMSLENPQYLEIGQSACEFLIRQTYNGSHFSFVGCKGWYGRGGTKARFDQQAIEPAGTILMLKSAYEATNNIRYLTLQRKVFDWFLGDNDLNIPVYNFKTKGCYDGLEYGDVNLNQGAESTLSFMLSLIEIAENYTICNELAVEKESDVTDSISTGPIEIISDKPKRAKYIEEPK